MSVILLLMLVMMGFAVAVLVRRGASARARVTEPSCGKCGYCVRGLQSLVCPECGSDLREVGIITPGSVKPMSTWMRLLAWTLFAPLPALLLAQLAAQMITPWQAVTTSRRVIFSHAPYFMATIDAQMEGTDIVFGRSSPAPGVPMNQLKLSIQGRPVGNMMSVELATNQARFTDGSGNAVVAPLDAKSIERWLAAGGFTNPRMAERSTDVLMAVNEMTSGQGRGFSRFAPDPGAGGIQRITAHPATPGFTTFRPTRFTPFVPWAVAAIVWLIGAGVVVLVARRVQSRRNADQA